MKKNILFTCLAALAVLCSCSDEISDNNDAVSEEGHTFTLTAKYPTATKATVNDATGEYVWQEGDKIGIFTDTGIYPLTLNSADAGNPTGTFTGTISGTATNYVVYPYNASDALSGTTLTMTLPSEYSTYDAACSNAVLVSKVVTTGTNTASAFDFKHLSAVVKVTFTNVPASATKFVMTGTGIAGSFTTDASADTPTLTAGTTTDQVTMALPATYSSTLSFYVPVPAGTYTLNVKLEDNLGNVFASSNKTKTNLTLAQTDLKLAGTIACSNGYYIYGASCNNLPIASALQMTDVSSTSYKVGTYFMKSSDSKNPILLNVGSKTLAYPCYALKSDGTVVKLTSASDVVPQGPVIDIDGMRSLTVDLSAMTWTWSRITIANYLPDTQVSSYGTTTITANGRSKVWMTQSLNYDSNAGVCDGVTLHLGCPLVTGTTSGYANPPLTEYDAAKESAEYSSTGFAVDETGTKTYGRLYMIDEILTGVPQNGLSLIRLGAEWPWKEGEEIIDAVGNTVKMKPLTAGVSDFSSEPTTTMQVQGICPYGWHIANAQDFYDLFCAAADKAGKTALSSSAMVGKWTGVASVLKMSGWGDGTDGLGIKFAPQGRRLFGSGWQYYTNPVGSSSRMEMFIFQPSAWGNGIANYTGGGAQVWRISAMTTTATDVTINTTYNMGDCAASFRCVKNYK